MPLKGQISSKNVKKCSKNGNMFNIELRKKHALKIDVRTLKFFSNI